MLHLELNTFNVIKNSFSLFVWNNETINVWSHLLGFVLFAVLLIYSVASSLLGDRISNSIVRNQNLEQHV